MSEIEYTERHNGDRIEITGQIGGWRHTVAFTHVAGPVTGEQMAGMRAHAAKFITREAADQGIAAR